MNWVLIAILALPLGIGIFGRADALPSQPPGAVLAAARSVPPLAAAYRRASGHSGDPAPAAVDPNASLEAAANGAPNAVTGSSIQWVDPPAASGGAKPPEASGAATPTAAPTQEPATTAPTEARPQPPIASAQHRRRDYRRYYGNGGGAWPGGGLLGIRLPFLGGL
jgi:hypothetical protein